jgi:membrane-associated protease RseP (regulator of RpoE activity)
VPIVVDRAGAEVTLQASIVTDKRAAFDADGNPITNADGTYQYQQVGFLGVTPATETVRQPLSAVPGFVGDALAKTFGVVWSIPQKMVGVVQAVAGSGERDPNGPVSLVGIGRVAGEVASAQAAPDITVTWWDRFAVLLSLIASLNLALFAFNLIPLLPLDGGHVAGALWEGLRRQVARLRRRPDPGPVDVARALPIAYGVASLLIGMSVLLIVADIVRPIKLGG